MSELSPSLLARPRSSLLACPLALPYLPPLLSAPHSTVLRCRVALDQEAARVARRAAEALRQSRLLVQQAPINQPTWTGRSGLAGAPGAPAAAAPRFGRTANPRLLRPPEAGAGPAAQQQPQQAARRAGPAAGAGAGAAPRSADILAQVRARQAAAASAGREPGGGRSAGGELARAQALAARLVGFLEGRGGAAPSDDIIAAFQDEAQGAEALAVFRGVLKQVAALQRQGGGPKAWVLRPEFAGGGGGGGGGA